MKTAPKANYDDDLASESDSKSSSPTALLPKSVLQGKGCEVGDTLTLTVTAIRDDEVQVEVSGREEPPESPEEEAPLEDSDESEMMPPEGVPAEGNYE
jgi:hypothetical protein